MTNSKIESGDNLIQFPDKSVGIPMIDFTQVNGKYNFSMSEAGKKCYLLRFLENASNFTWKKEESNITEDEHQQNMQHLLSKLCAIGYLLVGYKTPNTARAVIGMDEDESGRSGKWVIGELMTHIIPTTHMDGMGYCDKNKRYTWSPTISTSRLVFIDDLPSNFDFESLFPCITGDWQINNCRLTLPFSSSPKLYITTNHAIKGSGSSFTERQWLLAFSDFYNSVHKPTDDFDCLFFHGFDFEQWNLTYNLLPNCIHLYMKFGIVQAPAKKNITQ